MFNFNITKRYIPALLLISFFVILSNYLTNKMITSNNEYAEIINISGKQRMLSQKLLILSTNYHNIKTIENKKELENTLEEIELAHKYLLTKQFTQKIKNIYYQDNLDLNLKSYLDNFNNILKSNKNIYRVKASIESKNILTQLDSIVQEYEKYSNDRLEELKNYELYLMVITLFVLLFSALFIFRPASIKIEKQTKELIDKEIYEETIIESNNNAIIAIDWTGKITTYNKKAEEIFGWTKDEMLGYRNLLNIIPTKYKDLHTNASSKYLKSGKSCGAIGKSHELEGIRKNGEIFPIHISFGAKYKINNAIVVANIEDITNEKNQELLLMQQSKMASMGEMIGNIAHQWRQPLSAITTHASASIMKKELNMLDDKGMIDSYESIIEHAKFLSNTIDDFRDFFKETTESIPFDIFVEIDHIKSIVKNDYLKNKINIVEHNSVDKIICIGTKNKFGHVIMNILNNAKDALVENNIENKIVLIDIELLNNEIKIKIFDNAGGIPSNILEKVFEPYFTTKHQNQGTGIGLHMSSQIILKHFNGSLKATNETFTVEGKEHYGACFSINIPHN